MIDVANPQQNAPIYRLVVQASTLKAKQYAWVIVDDINHGIPVRISSDTFRSMEDAYTAGKPMLEYLQQKARREHPSLNWARLRLPTPSSS